MARRNFNPSLIRLGCLLSLALQGASGLAADTFGSAQNSAPALNSVPALNSAATSVLPANSWVCDTLRPWLDAEDRSYSPAYGVRDRWAWGLASDSRKNDVAATFFDALLAGRLHAADVDACIAQRSDRQDILNFIQAQFLARGIGSLNRSSGPPIQAFLSGVKNRFGDVRKIFFRMSGHFHETDPSEFRAGFHRASGSIYLNWDKVPANEWLLTLIHEIIHSIDHQLSEAVEMSSATEHVQRISTLAQKFTDFSVLSTTSGEDAQFLDRWVRAGLDRGLWAEYRAWAATLAIYSEGLREGFWQKINWLDTILESCPQGPEFDKCLYLYIDERSPDPKHGLAATPLVLSRIQALRAEQREWKIKLDLGNLGLIAQ